jgi:DNA modification methylase
MGTFITLSNKKSRIPKEFQADDNRFPESLVKYLLERYSKKGDKVIDIFAGLGTTLIVAEKMGRMGYGIEMSLKRVKYIQSKIKAKNNIIFGSALFPDKNLPQMDLCITSPPYMSKSCKENPLGVPQETYEGYLDKLVAIFTKLKPFMKKNAYIFIEASNLKGKETTTLAWDIAKKISQIYSFEGEVVVGWQGKGTCKGAGTYGYGYDHSYCLVFRN